MNTDPYNVLPSELGEALFLVFLVGPVMHGVVGLSRDQLPTLMTQAEKFLDDHADHGEDSQQVALTLMFQALVTAPGNKEAMAHAAMVATWLVLTHPAPETTVTRDSLKWITFGAKEEAYVYDGGEDDGAFEASRVALLADCVGIQQVHH